jgi:hypothetical protein
MAVSEPLRDSERYGPFLPIKERFTQRLYLPSLDHKFIEGPALRYTLFLPLRTMKGEEVFSTEVEGWLTELLNHHFRGSTQFRTRPVPPLMGAWPGQVGVEFELVNMITVYSCFDEKVTGQLFKEVGVTLRALTLPPQDDILIERLVVELISCRGEGEPLDRSQVRVIV